MPESNLGGLTLPIPAGTLNSDLDDPAISALADYLRFWLRSELNTKLANMQGTSTDACPSANVFKFDPSTYWVRNPVPALYVWWEGKSATEQFSMLYDWRKRDVQVMWIYDELVAPNGLSPRHGLLAAVDAVFHKAADRWHHPSYALGSGPSNQMLPFQIAFPGLVEIKYLGGTPGMVSTVPQTDARSGGEEGHVVRGFPALRAKFSIQERIEQDTPGDNDGLGDITINMRGNDGSSNEYLDIMTRYVEGPDGSEQED